MTEQPELHASIVAMVSLTAGIASNHPHMGLCQLNRLRAMGIPEHQLDSVVEIARHIRDEAAQKLDANYDEQATTTAAPPVNASDDCGCSVTPMGQSCC